MKTRPSMTILGHENGTKIKILRPLSTQSWRMLHYMFMKHRRWKQDLVWQFWVMGTVLKSTYHGSCRPKVDVCYSIRSWNKWQWKQDLVWQFLFMGTVLKSTYHGPCRPKNEVCYSIFFYERKAMKTRTSLTILGHETGIKINISLPLSTQSWRMLQHTFMEHSRWKQDLV